MKWIRISVVAFWMLTLAPAAAPACHLFSHLFRPWFCHSCSNWATSSHCGCGSPCQTPCATWVPQQIVTHRNVTTWETQHRRIVRRIPVTTFREEVRWETVQVPSTRRVAHIHTIPSLTNVPPTINTTFNSTDAPWSSVPAKRTVPKSAPFSEKTVPKPRAIPTAQSAKSSLFKPVRTLPHFVGRR